MLFNLTFIDAHIIYSILHMHSYDVMCMMYVVYVLYVCCVDTNVIHDAAVVYLSHV